MVACHRHVSILTIIIYFNHNHKNLLIRLMYDNGGDNVKFTLFYNSSEMCFMLTLEGMLIYSSNSASVLIHPQPFELATELMCS